MELKITEEKENKLFNRREIKGSLESNATPSRQDTSKLLAEKFSVPPENIKIKKITGKFGSRTFDIEANIYSSEQEKDSIELKKKKDSRAEKKTEETEETPKTAEAEKQASAEKPAEETRQQSKQEETKPETEKKPEEKKEENLEKKEEESKPEPQ